MHVQLLTSTTQPDLYSQKESPITELSLDISKFLFSFFKGEEVPKLGQVCKNFEKVAADEELWKVLFNQDFSNLTPNESKSFKEQYKLRFMIERNWDQDRSILKTLRIENVWGSERFYIFQDLIVCPGVNDSFNVYDKNTLKKLYYSRGHCGIDLEGFQDDGDHLISYTNGGPCSGVEVKVWEKNTGNCISTISDCLRFLVDGDLVLGKKINMTSLQSQLVVWNKLTGSLIHTLDPNQGSEIMAIDDTRFFASMEDGSIKAWLKSEGSFIGVFDCGETDPARALVEVNDILISGHKSGIIRVWEKKEKTVIQELIDPEQEKLEPITLLKIEAGFLICKSKNYIKIWSEKDRILLCTVGQGSSWMFDHDILYVGLETGCIEARDTKTGVIRFKLESSGGSEVTKIAINGTRLVALTKNGMEIWNLKTKVLMKSINDIAQFYLEDDRIIASAKGEIKIWDFSNLNYNSNV